MGNKVYKHIPTGMLLILVRERKTGFNTFLDCDINGNVILKKREWSNSCRKTSQERLIKGFENLKPCTSTTTKK